ncbi:MAG: DUF882 domain-containing protein [Bacteroidaceae bacterium]|nr:DUF882 domain-containing protein [Bacteroidaceae bacterium]
MDMKLSEHFTLEELTRSDTAKAKKLDNTPDATVLGKLSKLCNELLEVVRKEYGYPIKVTSGYRSPKVNAAVGGAKTSQHMYGEAADLKAIKTTNKQLFDVIAKLIKDKKIQCGQLIWEYGTKKEPGWVHLSLPRTNKPNNQILYLGVK